MGRQKAHVSATGDWFFACGGAIDFFEGFLSNDGKHRTTITGPPVATAGNGQDKAKHRSKHWACLQWWRVRRVQLQLCFGWDVSVRGWGARCLCFSCYHTWRHTWVMKRWLGLAQSVASPPHINGNCSSVPERPCPGP